MATLEMTSPREEEETRLCLGSRPWWLFIPGFFRRYLVPV